MSGTRNNGTSGGRRRAARAAAEEESVAAEAVAPPERGDAGVALDRLAADLRALLGLARSAALPPAKRVDDLERSTLRHLAEARALLGSGTPEEPEAPPPAIPSPAAEAEVDAAWNASDQAHPTTESSQA